MQSPMKILLTAGLGAAAMYYLDPVQGRERRDVARERLEQGRDGLQQAGRTARAVGHDVGERSNRAVRGLRSAGHDLGDRGGRFAHGLRELGHDTRERAAGAVSSLGSLFDRDRASSRRASGRSALKLAGIPVKWLLVAGVGATAMYFLDPSQGLYRRVRFRNRFLQNRSGRMNGSGVRDDEPQAAARPRPGDAGDGSGRGDEQRPLPG